MSIKELRLKNGLSQEQLANLSKLSTRTIQRIEKENNASIESLRALSLVFNIQVEELIGILQKNEQKEERKEVSSSVNIFQDKGLIIFILVNSMLFIINILTSEHMWFIYPLVGWGISLIYRRIKRKVIIA